MNSSPIGMFDSGVGGLTVLKEVMKELPNEDVVYLGDTKRFPYGTKSKETIIKCTRDAVEFFAKVKPEIARIIEPDLFDVSDLRYSIISSLENYEE